LISNKEAADSAMMFEMQGFELATLFVILLTFTIELSSLLVFGNVKVLVVSC
jgi:hypothetical protein